MIQTADELFQSTLLWLQMNYSSSRFFLERDIVWAVQNHIIKLITEHNLPYKVFNDYPILPAPRKWLVDLVILDNHDCVEVAAEFKYEPSHNRSGNDIWPTKVRPSVVFWEEGVGNDISRIQTIVVEGKAKVAYSIFVDEDGHFQKRSPHPGSEWVEWANGVQVLYSRVEAIPSTIRLPRS